MSKEGKIVFCTGGGCTAKLGAGALSRILEKLPRGARDPSLLVGYDSRDDAAVYRITDDVALVQTVDFFPPMVDDPYTFGQIAAANALSDVYAMGGEVKTALNLVCFPESICRRDLAEGVGVVHHRREEVHRLHQRDVVGDAVDSRIVPAVVAHEKVGVFLTPGQLFQNMAQYACAELGGTATARAEDDFVLFCHQALSPFSKCVKHPVTS